MASKCYRAVVLLTAFAFVAAFALAACGPRQSTETSKWDGSVDTSWFQEDQTSFDLKSAAQLAGLAQLVDEGQRFEGCTVNLRVNVDLDDLDWNPIGGIPSQGEGTFCGVFDGNNNAIANLYIVSQLGNQALFASTNGGAIQNVVVRGEVMGREGASGVVSEASNTSFRNVVADVDVFSTNYYDNTDAAGLVGNVLYSGEGQTYEIVDCLNNGRIHANDWEVGGLVGQLTCAENTTVVVRNCTNQGYVGVDAVGKALDQSVGGLVGKTGGLGSYTFDNCRNLADVYATEVMAVGGIVGHIVGADTHFKNCANEGAISSDSLEDTTCVGGIFATYGMAGFTVEGCSNTGELSAFRGETYDLARGMGGA